MENIALNRRKEQQEIQDQLNEKEKKKQLFLSILPFAGLIFIVIFLGILTGGKLFSTGNLMNIVNQCFTVAIIGIGASFVYAHGGMDFSMGPICGLAQYMCVVVLANLGLPIWVAFIVAIITGIFFSSIVGSVSILLGVPVFVVSLCVRSFSSGILTTAVNSAGGEVNINYAQYSHYGSIWAKFIVLIVFVIVGNYLFEKTAFGKVQKAMGGNETTVLQGGVNTSKYKILAYSLMGLCIGVAGFFQLMRFGTVSGQSGSGLEFEIMIAMVLGGFPMQGGNGAKLRALLIGALTITILSNGLTLASVDVSYVNALKGILLIIIVGVSYDRSSMKQISIINM